MNDQSPQLEEGYIRIATEIWEVLGRYRLSGEEWLVLNCIIRKTYGWNKKEDKISLRQISDYTGLNRPNVARSIKKLINKNVIKKDNSYVNSYCFNKKYREWVVLSKKITVSKSVIKNDNRVLSKKITKVLSKKIPTIYNINTNTKDINTLARPRDLTSLKEEAHKKIGGISTVWQDKAFRTAETLKINLKDSPFKGRWLKFFKDNQNGKVDMAVSYLVDYPPFNVLDEDEHKMKYFFAYYYGLKVK